mgnify:CR=1 FL=1
MEIKSTKIEPRESLPEKTDLLPGLGDQNGLSTSETKSFLGIIGSVFQKIKSHIESPERNAELEEQKTKEDFEKDQYYMVDKDLDKVISLRKEYGLPVIPAVQDYIDFVQGRDDVTDAYGLKTRAKYALKDQIIAEEKGNKNLLDSLYDEGKLSSFHDEEKNTKELYGDMTEEEYNAWRAKAADKTREFIAKMDKKLVDKLDYLPDTLNSVLEYRLYQVLKNSSTDNLRENLENQFYGELVGNNLIAPDEGGLYPISTFSNFQNALISAGLLTPKDNFINKHEASYDLYQKDFEKNNDLRQEEYLALEIAKDKELLREGKFDELLEKDHGKVLNEEIKRLQALKTNATLNEKNQKIYEERLNSALRNFSELAIINFYNGDVNIVRDVANSRDYNDFRLKIKESFFSLNQNNLDNFKYGEKPDLNGDTPQYRLEKLLENFKTNVENFINFREQQGLPRLEGVVNSEKTLSEINDEIKNIARYEQYYGVSNIEEGRKVDSAFKSLFLQDVDNYDHDQFRFEKLNSDFDKLYKEANRQKDLRIADKIALEFFKDIKDGVVTSTNLEQEIENRFGKELKSYEQIEWRASPLATTMLQAIGFLKEDLTYSKNAIEHLNKEVGRVEEQLNIKNLAECLSLPSVIKEKDPNIKELISLLVSDFDPAYKMQGRDMYGLAEKINNPYERERIFEKDDDIYPTQALPSLRNLVIFERKKGLIEGLERGTTTLEDFANKYGDEYKKLLNDAKESLNKNFEALAKGFKGASSYEKYLSTNPSIDPDALINKIKNDGLKEKNKVIDINIEFIREVADGKHQKFIEKVIDLVKDQYQGPVNMQALVTQVYTRGAKAVIAKEGLDGRTKAAKFIKSVEKTIKSLSEPSL